MPRQTTNERAKPSSLGTVRRRSSGRFSASYRIDGRQFSAPRTFATKTEAEGWLATERADRLRGTWRDPSTGRVTVADYLTDWLASRSPQLSASTRDSYARSINRWIIPRLTAGGHAVELGTLNLDQLTPAVIRRWWAVLSEATEAASLARLTYTPTGHPARVWARENGHPIAWTGRIPPDVLTAWKRAGSPLPTPRRRPGTEHVDPGKNTAARTYACLRAALGSAVDDGLLTANPCRIRGAGNYQPAERPTCTPEEVQTLAAHMPEHLRAAVLVAAWSGLRRGELFALARRHVDTAAGTLRVERSLTKDNRVHGRTKTRGSARTVHLPRFVADALADHLAAHTRPGPDALVFATEAGRPVDSPNLSHMFARARAALGRPELHWHDLRHTGATLAYAQGANVREVQRRLGHTTVRAAMIYAHAADESDAVLAARLDAAYADTQGDGPTPEPPRRRKGRKARRAPVEPGGNVVALDAARTARTKTKKTRTERTA